MGADLKIAVLMTCHNRKETTLRCLELLYAQLLPEEVSFNVYLVDDGCTDGTGEAVKKAYPDITVLQGDGSLFWCNGMRLAWDVAAKEDPDFYLWLNDDSMLEPHAVSILLETASSADDAGIVVGSCCDASTGGFTYGGQRRSGAHPSKLVPVEPGEEPVVCDTFQGNIVLVSRGTYQKAGNLQSFKHAIGDTDYGYRAQKAGCAIYVAPGFVATCSKNAHSMERMPLDKRWKTMMTRLPPGDYYRFLRQHAGIRWVFYWPRPYIRILFSTRMENQ
ncbi:N-acetylglucosaminyl-diphospho-decaprenol L-rhamnosyltransferase [Pontiella desulfatans]|uniref:N-acetylglucosaminyl-diphospho-decaprenol L-rhamnosyltransferase n=1 Tax=Pontiella desulfatans TaxID=2750659 RepID=A0A6C2TX25_PONDE|nr:N-acetylglucosaminyl-diphospho-decaprenol L-rhamnosyltransferase [Pontiella desulfatans]